MGYYKVIRPFAVKRGGSMVKLKPGTVHEAANRREAELGIAAGAFSNDLNAQVIEDEAGVPVVIEAEPEQTPYEAAVEKVAIAAGMTVGQVNAMLSQRKKLGMDRDEALYSARQRLGLLTYNEVIGDLSKETGFSAKWIQDEVRKMQTGGETLGDAIWYIRLACVAGMEPGEVVARAKQLRDEFSYSQDQIATTIKAEGIEADTEDNFSVGDRVLVPYDGDTRYGTVGALVKGGKLRVTVDGDNAKWRLYQASDVALDDDGEDSEDESESGDAAEDDDGAEEDEDGEA